MSHGKALFGVPEMSKKTGFEDLASTVDGGVLARGIESRHPFPRRNTRDGVQNPRTGDESASERGDIVDEYVHLPQEVPGSLRETKLLPLSREESPELSSEDVTRSSVVEVRDIIVDGVVERVTAAFGDAIQPLWRRIADMGCALQEQAKRIDATCAENRQRSAESTAKLNAGLQQSVNQVNRLDQSLTQVQADVKDIMDILRQLRAAQEELSFSLEGSVREILGGLAAPQSVPPGEKSHHRRRSRSRSHAKSGGSSDRKKSDEKKKKLSAGDDSKESHRSRSGKDKDKETQKDRKHRGLFSLS
ncbi:hypothetical protein HIM_11600 [Hirsutella minnesotensis 3608]|uniref:Uncharacterized protein n=1 Tax=Hirsutella minnesotensis 3608 TaxID=1043627 RepID=A0A0F7ZFE7_9HYPO|nr:hypothetical protein HIM_11600 [Hirsutella minnesotensis 3608]